MLLFSLYNILVLKRCVVKYFSRLVLPCLLGKSVMQILPLAMARKVLVPSCETKQIIFFLNVYVRLLKILKEISKMDSNVSNRMTQVQFFRY